MTFVRLFEDLYDTNARQERWNYSQVVLLPKEDAATTISQYRPIALLNSSFKIISNALANRITLSWNH